MKSGCLWAFVTWIGTVVSLVVVSLAISAIWPVRFDPERVGDLGSRIGLFVVFVVFLVIWIRQANRKERQPEAPAAHPAAKPENLAPIDYSHLSHIFDDTDRKA